MLLIGMLLGASVGPVLIVALAYLEPSGRLIFSFVLGAFVAVGVCVACGAIAALLILPRILTSARGTLTSVVDDIALASRAHAEGNLDGAIDHFGRAVREGVAWYSTRATWRFITQAGLGLLISFGGIIGAVLLLNQNALVTEQNNKIEQQTMVADAQKRGAFVAEMFSILAEVAKTDRADGMIPKELVTRIAVLTTSAVPYVYLDFYGGQAGSELRRIPRALSPERGQLIVALSRMKVKLSPLYDAGAVFTFSDLRGADLREADLSNIDLSSSDLSSAMLLGANLTHTILIKVVLKGATARLVNFSYADFSQSVIENSDFWRAEFFLAKLAGVTIVGGDVTSTKFVLTPAGRAQLSFKNAAVQHLESLPAGLPWPQDIKDGYSRCADQKTLSELKHKPLFTLNYTFAKSDD